MSPGSIVFDVMKAGQMDFWINGASVQVEAAADLLLVDLLRDGLRLTGTHRGCDTAQCGACTVIADNVAIKACNVLASQMAGRRITTIEGLASGEGDLHPMQKAFSRHHALQCGFCTPGLVMRAVAMASEDVPASAEAVRHALSGNLCRCTGYEGIVSAVCEGISAMRADAGVNAFK